MSSEGKAKKFEDLLVWQKSHQLVLDVYRITRDFPQEEKFGLVAQMRRAAVSIAANIVEGFRKRSKRDKVNFYNIAQGSTDELRYFLILGSDLGLVTQTKDKLLEQSDEVARMLNGLTSAINSRP